MKDYQTIALELADDVAVLSLNRADKMNALNTQMRAEITDAAGFAGRKARVLVLTGAGKVFSAGADIEAARAGLATSPLWDRLSGALAGFPGLSVAALNGSCAGGSMGMMLACDLRLAVDIDPQSFF